MNNQNEKEYSVGIWELTYYKVDPDTGDALCDDEGNVIQFHVLDQDCSSIAEYIEIDDLIQIKP